MYPLPWMLGAGAPFAPPPHSARHCSQGSSLYQIHGHCSYNCNCDCSCQVDRWNRFQLVLAYMMSCWECC